MTGFFWEYFLFYVLAGFWTAWLEGTGYLLVQNSFHFSPEFWHESRMSFHDDLCPKNWYSLSLFPLMKRVLLPALGFWPIIWPLSSSSLCLAIRSGYYTDLCMSPSPSMQLQSVSSSWLSFWPEFVASFNRQAEELTYIPYSSFNDQSLRPVNSNTEGLGKFLISLLSVTDHVTKWTELKVP